MNTIFTIGLVCALSFTRHQVGPLGYSHDISGVDIDNDADVDVVAAGRNADQLTWFEWLGPDNFTAHVVHTANSVIGCWAGDLDQDGDNDLAMASVANLMWFENDGSENFTAHTLYSSASTGWRVNVADLDNDGDNDFLFTDWTGNLLLWFENDGSENFTQHIVDPNLSQPHEVWGLDLDNDGDKDIMATSWANGDVYWYENDGWQNFTRHLVGNTGSEGCWDAVPFDIDADGDPDIAATNYSGVVLWFENDGSANWTSHIVDNAFGGSVHGICVADFNGDGYGDIIATGYSGIVKAYEYPSWEVSNIDNLSGSLALYAADMDRDGDQDFLLSNDVNYWFENTTPAGTDETAAEPDNPVEIRYLRSGFEIVLCLPAKTDYSLDLFSPSGRKVKTISSGVSSGSPLRWQENLDGSGRVFYVVLRTENATYSSVLVQ